jgi:hypothetical protein
MGADGRLLAFATLLSQTNEILQDMPFIEGNLPTGHVVGVETGLPTATWRRLYGTVQPSKATTEQVTEGIGMLEAYNEIDVDVANLNGNTAEFRLRQAQRTVEGMNQNLAETLFYGNTLINPERFEGFTPRFNSLAAPNAENIIPGGGVGADNRSIWLIVWSPATVFGITPKGSQSGLKMEDKGQVTSENKSATFNGGLMEVYRTHFQIKAGLCVADWRYVVRICNIDRSDLTANAATGANLPNLMFEALARIPSMGMGRAAFYSSRDVWTKFRQQLAAATAASTLTVENVGGVLTTSWHGIPLRQVDRLAVNEALVT